MSSSTHGGALRLVARAVDDDVFRLQPHRQARPVAEHGVDRTMPGMSMCATESPNSYGLVCCSLDRPFADDRALVPAGARRLQLLEDLRQQLALEQPKGLRRQLEAAALALLQPLLLGHLAQVVLDLLLQCAELLDVARLGELRPAPPCR